MPGTGLALPGLHRCLSLPHSWEFFGVGPKHRQYVQCLGPTLEPNCPSSNPDPIPSCATSDQVSELSVPPYPNLQKEGTNILTSEGSREDEVLRAGSAHRKLSVHILAIVTIITNPTADIYIALHSLQSIFRHIISLNPGDIGGGGVSTELLG